MAEKKLQHGEISWEDFLQHFQKQWLSQLFYDKKTSEFYKLIMGVMSVMLYHEQFFHLVKYVTQYHNDDLFTNCKFFMGLGPNIYNEVEMHKPESMDYVLRKTLKQEQ